MNDSFIASQLQKHCAQTYICNSGANQLDRKNMLIVSHCLERGGAPLVLIELLDFFQEHYNVFFLFEADGNLHDDILSRNISVYIGGCLNFAGCDPILWKSFDLVFMNTLISGDFLPFFQNRNMPVLWWLHEPEVLFQSTYGQLIHFALLSKNIRILSVTDATSSYVRKYYGINSPVFHMGLKDMYQNNDNEPTTSDRKIRFFMPAKFQMLKAQDLLANAILDLPSSYAERSEFIFSGPRDSVQPEYFELVQKLAVACPHVKMLGEITKEEVYQIYPVVDCVLAPSRADATPTTIVEGMMFRCISLCSDAAGISQYISDGVNGFVFPSNDANSLREKIMYIIDHIQEMDQIRDNGREIYLKYFSYNMATDYLLNTIAELEQ